MAEPGTILKDVVITEIGFGGEGVARLEDGAVVFIPFTAVGDVLTVEITEARKNFYRACVRSIQTPGPGRETPICPYYGRCGGCTYQHLSYEAEVNAKKGQFKSVITRLGHFSEFPELEKFAASPMRFGYRNKLRLEPIARPGRPLGARLQYGFCERDNETFFPVKSCALASDGVNAELKNALLSPWAEQNAKRPKPYPLTLRQDSTGTGAYYFGFASSKLKWLHENLHGKDISVPVGSFWQVNPLVAEELLTTIGEWLKPVGARALVDAYAGVGTFSLALGELFQYRVIIENDKNAVAASRANHERLGMKAKYVAGNTEDALADTLAKVNCGETVVVIDPPRTGCQPKVINTLLDFKPATVVYVSCNPSTLARDLKILCADGAYKPIRAAAFDMFPGTAHFESAVLLQKA